MRPLYASQKQQPPLEQQTLAEDSKSDISIAVDGTLDILHSERYKFLRSSLSPIKDL